MEKFTDSRPTVIVRQFGIANVTTANSLDFKNVTSDNNGPLQCVNLVSKLDFVVVAVNKV